jgi:hypothetical protein
MVAAALIDRLAQHATMITLKGKSYRLRERTASNSNRPLPKPINRALMTRAAVSPATPARVHPQMEKVAPNSVPVDKAVKWAKWSCRGIVDGCLEEAAQYCV